MLVRITNMPTAIRVFFTGILPTNRAAIGAAITPPIINPRMSSMGRCLSNIKKVMALDNTTKNSAKQTEPITYRGLFLLEISVLVTKAPHPPPAKASVKPPRPANQPAPFTLEINCFFFKALRIM